MKKTGWDGWGDSRSGVGSGQRASAVREEEVVEAGGSFQQRAGHCWAVAAVPKAAAAEAAGATRNNMHRDT